MKKQYLVLIPAALVVVGGHVLHFSPTVMAVVGAVICFGIRLIAIRRGWRLPVAELPQRFQG